MKGWLASIFAISVFTVMLNLLLKKTRIQKTIQSVLSILLSVTFLQPVFSLKNGKGFLFENWKEESVQVSLSVEEILTQAKINFIQEKIAEKLKDSGIHAEIQVYGNFSNEIKVEKVLVKLNLSSISTQKLNIVEIRRTVSAYAGVLEEDVTVYAK
ncbi:MAG: hypothetical protein IKC56_00620 [Clostridia bacterium]|nr:hypothetical protein [Clostridia bacterium]